MVYELFLGKAVFKKPIKQGVMKLNCNLDAVMFL